MSKTSKQAPPNQRKNHPLPSQKSDHLELLWDDLLSRRPERVRSAFNSLDLPSQKSVLAHLQRMANEIGWQSEQRLSALAAIQALQDTSQQEGK